jgi:hypothetical protein
MTFASGYAVKRHEVSSFDYALVRSLRMTLRKALEETGAAIVYSKP